MASRRGPPTWEEVWKILVEYLPLENPVLLWEAEPEENLVGLGVTGLSLVQVAVAIEEEFDILVNQDHVEHWRTVGDIVRYTQQRWEVEFATNPR